MTQPSDPGGPSYPRQDLLPHHVQPRRRRWPLAVAAAAIVVAVVGGLLVWRLAFHDNGEEHRAAYCVELRRLVNGAGLGALAQGGGSQRAGITDRLDRIRALAPASVASQWDDLAGLVAQSGGSTPDAGQLARAFGDLQAIVSDARSACGITVQFPG